MEIPFFVGVVNQNKLSMSIYSGDMIPEIFSLVGLPPSDPKSGIIAKAALLENRDKHGQKPRQKTYVIPFYKIGEVFASNTDEQLISFIGTFSNICLNYQKNIIAKKNHEYIFHDAATLESKIVFGGGSYKVFRNNLFERLAEVFCNLAWICPQMKDEEDKNKFMKEYHIYKRFYYAIRKCYGNIAFLESSFQILENAVKNHIK